MVFSSASMHLQRVARFGFEDLKLYDFALVWLIKTYQTAFILSLHRPKFAIVVVEIP
jgi:hypothetical protein